MNRLTFVERTGPELFTAQIEDAESGARSLLRDATLYSLKVQVLNACGPLGAEQLERIDSLFNRVAERVYDLEPGEFEDH